MYSFIYKLYFYLKRKEKTIKEKNGQPQIILEKLLNRIEWFYNVPIREWYIKHPSKRYGVAKNPRDQRIIVSLTSHPKRIDTVWLTIETLLRQSVKPDAVILWLARTQFENMQVLPKELLCQMERGLSIRFCDDLRSHKKYFYVMQEYSEDLVILVDDDMFYPRDTVKKLLNLHSKNPNDICTMTAQVMGKFLESKPSMWRNPKVKEKFRHSDKIQIFTGSGSLYPPHSLDKKVFDIKLIRKLCPYADDLWLTFMAYRNNTKITAESPWRSFPIPIYGTAEESLWHINAAEGKNDEQWNAILEYFSGDME